MSCTLHLVPSDIKINISFSACGCLHNLANFLSDPIDEEWWVLHMGKCPFWPEMLAWNVGLKFTYLTQFQAQRSRAWSGRSGWWHRRSRTGRWDAPQSRGRDQKERGAVSKNLTLHTDKKCMINQSFRLPTPTSPDWWPTAWVPPCKIVSRIIRHTHMPNCLVWEFSESPNW